MGLKKRDRVWRGIACSILLASGLLTGCMNFGGGISPSTLPITEKDAYTSLGEVSGSDGTLVLLLPLAPTSAHEAIQEAKRKKGADALINVRVENRSYLYPILPIGYTSVKVSGEAIKFQRNAAN